MRGSPQQDCRASNGYSRHITSIAEAGRKEKHFVSDGQQQAGDDGTGEENVEVNDESNAEWATEETLVSLFLTSTIWQTRLFSSTKAAYEDREGGERHLSVGKSGHFELYHWSHNTHWMEYDARGSSIDR
jgi:hypothetical protein